MCPRGGRPYLAKAAGQRKEVCSRFYDVTGSSVDKRETRHVQKVESEKETMCLCSINIPKALKYVRLIPEQTWTLALHHKQEICRWVTTRDDTWWRMRAQGPRPQRPGWLWWSHNASKLRSTTGHCSTRWTSNQLCWISSCRLKSRPIKQL